MLKKNKCFTTVLIVFCIVFSMFITANAVTVSIGIDGTANFTNAQFYVLGSSNVTTYTSSSGTTVSGSIYPNDLCTVLDATGTYWKVSYPTSGGSKIAYCNKTNILSNTSYCKRISVYADSTVYRKSDMSTSFGTALTTDKIYMLSPISNGRSQIIYPTSSGYKIGWIYATAVTSASFTAEKSKFPSGKYWCHTPGAQYTADTISSSPCTCDKHGGGHTTNDLLTGSCGCNSFEGAIQCMGFARKVGYDLFGTSVTSWKRSTLTNDVETLSPGDYIRFKNDGHSAIVTSIDNTYIYVVECNADGKCGIRWGGAYSISTVKNSLTEIRRHP
ncbi:MAG: hypothetical protein N2645_18530 [Clostridia bacterium]|nr:hypothetical protein [Clostridia bacterium]